MENPIHATYENITSRKLRDIQRETGLGDDLFAARLGISLAQLLQHKHGEPITGPLRSLLILMRQDPRGAAAEIGNCTKVGGHT